ncbi:two-component system, response regulator YesN [Paenibacillus catalpae]|uniref:Two-component system, response regulator YesN n=1 Tax=Paenibacillus catalpae TaxID=1045775 RepID=A0A1I2AXI0_9BACL|nr:response regulator [Paenibacillus catalpae]SFE48348.1 two-component system, response regulator YesN [Paenibacillus catalpae]
MNILIVDDEPRHLRGMAGMIQSMRPAAKVMTAKDGEAALALVREERPDVVLSDIQMPNLDGLSFLQQLKEEELQSKVVMVSAYNLFEYAQKAIRHGAFDYLLKPIDRDKVEAVLQRLEKEISEEARQRGESADIRSKLKHAESAYRSRMLHQWLIGELQRDQGAELEEWPMLQQVNALLLTDIRMVEAAEVHPPQLMEELPRQLKKLGEKFGQVCVFPLQTMQQGGRLVTALALEPLSGLSTAELAAALKDCSSSWQLHGKVIHGMAIRAGKETIPDLYHRAERALHYAFHEEWHGVVSAEELAAKETKEALYMLDGELLFEALQEASLNKAEEMCREAFRTLAAGGYTDPKLMINYAALTLIKIKSRTSGIIDPHVGSVLTEAASTSIPSCSTSNELLEHLLCCLAAVHQALAERKQGSGDAAVEQCLSWIQTHYNEDLTLEMAAERFHFNPSYFSTLIKSRTGRSFSDHLTESRIREAKALLASGKLKIYEIAERCGYRDTKYFTRIFKRQVGLSPEAYKHTARPLTGGDTP